MPNKITQVIDVDTKGGVKNVGALTKELGEAETAGKQVAKALSQSADDIEADLKGTAKAADALGQALGPEMAAKLGQNGVVNVVGDLKKLGLTSDDIVTDVDELADSIKRLDAAGSSLNGPKQGLDDVGDAADKAKGHLGEMRGESDNSRSVLANMVGNSTQDVANLGGVAGTAGLALGQMGEYAADGNISLQGLAKVAGPMAGVTVVAMGISKVLGDIAKIKAFDKKQVDDWRQSIKDSVPPADHLREILEETGKLEFHNQITDSIQDVIPALDTAGVSLDQFNQLVEGGAPLIEKYRQAMLDQGETYRGTAVLDEASSKIVQAATDIHKKRAEAIEQSEAVSRILGDTDAETARETAKLTAGLEQGTDSLEANRAAAERATGQLHFFEAQTTAADDAYSKLTGKLDEEDAWANAQQAIQDFGEKGADATAQDVRDLTRDLADYVAGTDLIPAEKKTEIYALLDQGDVIEAKHQIDELTKDRTVNIKFNTSQGSTEHGGSQGKNPPDPPVVVEGDAEGTSHSADVFIAGENGPELVVGKGGSTVYPADKTAGMLGGGMGGNSYQIQLVMPVIASQADYYRAGQQLTAALAEYERRRGF